MNEVFRRRLIGLAVLLVLVFILSLLLPKDDDANAPGEPASTTVSLVDATPLATPDPAPAPAPESTADAAEAASAATTPAPPATPPIPAPTSAPAISDLHEEAPPVPAPRKPAPDEAGPSTVTPSATPHTALKLAPTVSTPTAKPDPAHGPKSAAPAAAPTPSPSKPAPALHADAALSPPKPKLAESVAKAPVSAPAPAAIAPPPAAGWYVQIGSFSDAGKAQTILSLLQKVGYKGEISKIVSASGATLHRVRLGAFASEALAKQAQERVARQGYPQARVVSEGGSGK